MMAIVICGLIGALLACRFTVYALIGATIVVAGLAAVFAPGDGGPILQIVAAAVAIQAGYLVGLTLHHAAAARRKPFDLGRPRLGVAER